MATQPKCSKKECGDEKDFENFIINKSKTMLSNNYKIDKKEGVAYTPDIVWKKDEKIYIVEVKKCHHNHRIFTGIGQLVYHASKYVEAAKEKIYYELALPKYLLEKGYINKNFIEHISKKYAINIALYDWEP